MTRITNSLFESIQKVTAGEVAEASVDKTHYCATHVEHSLLGYGECISEQHAEPDENGDIAWYTVQFPTGTHKISTSQLRIVEGKSHTHSKKMAENTEAIEEAEGGVPKTERHKKLATHYGDPNRITRGDIITAAKKNAMKKEEVEKLDEIKDTSAFDWKSKVKAPDSKFSAKKTSTGTIYTKKYKEEKDEDDLKSPSRRARDSAAVLGKGEPPKKKPMKEGTMQTIINHNDFVLEVTDNPTFKDYFAAMQAIVPSLDENIQQEMITIATEAYKEGYIDVILESMAKQAFVDRINSYRKAGYEVYSEKYVVNSGDPYVEYTVEKDGEVTKFVHTGVAMQISEEDEIQTSVDDKGRIKFMKDPKNPSPQKSSVDDKGRLQFKDTDRPNSTTVDDKDRIHYMKDPNNPTPQYSSVDSKGKLQYKGPTAGPQQTTVDDKDRIIFRK